MQCFKRIQIYKSAILLFTLIFIIINFYFVQIIKAEEIQHTKYFTTEQITLPDGNILEKSIISGPPEPPIGFKRVTLSSLPLPRIDTGLNTILDVPAFSWSFGCSATSAAMIAGHYDRNGYSDMYTGPTNNGKMVLNNDDYWTTWEDSEPDTRHRCPLSATQKGLDGRTSNGHVDDYWIYCGQPGPDPFDGNWTEHTHGECTADYMGTNQWTSPMDNIDGGTSFWNYSTGEQITAASLYAMGPTYYNNSGLCGVKEFYESRGYTVITAYNQYIYPYGTNTIGFTYAQYKAEIDAGRPVMFHVEGHTMVGIGYDDSSSDLMYIHDTWDHSAHTMIWGGSYSGMTHYAVTIVVLEESTEPQGKAMPWLQLLLLNGSVGDSPCSFKIPDTGQTTCYDTDGNTINPCPSAGQDFYGQDACYNINPPSYTKLDSNGNALPLSAADWVMVKDNVTGLIWEKKTDDGSIHDKDNQYNFSNASTVFIANLNSNNFGGYSDWHMPNINELRSIMQYGIYNPAINKDYFPDTMSAYYWSGTTYANDTDRAWAIYFRYGDDSYSAKSSPFMVRAVRSGQ